MKKLFYFPAMVVFIGIVVGCASIGTPGGGPRDEDPPYLVSANPLPASTDVVRDRIVLEFNEIVNVKDAFTNVVMSPSTKSVPRVTANGRRVTIQLPDSLESNTTYTIDFGTSISDNNEGNKLKGFSYTFSTGPVLDTLRVAGMVLGAQDLEPQKGMLVGLYSNLADSAFTSEKMKYIAKTDDYGRFIIRGLPAGTYRVVALGDNDNDMKYANPEEDLAFYDVFVSPSSERTTVTDTILNLKTGEIDTIVSRERTVYLPNTILLRSFNSGVRPQYLVKYERPDSARIVFQLNTPAATPPTFDIPGMDLADLRVERSATNDTLTYWLPRRIACQDTLRVAFGYERPDSAGLLKPTVDSLSLIYKRPIVKAEKPKKKKDEATDSIPKLPKTPTLNWRNASGSSTQEVWQMLSLLFDHPLESFDTTAFRLEQKYDTLWRPSRTPLKFEGVDSLNPRKYTFSYPWESGVNYRLMADSASAVSMYGEVLEKLSYEFSTKPIEDYATYRFKISGLPDSVPAFVELLNTSDSPVRKAIVENGEVLFKFLYPGKFYARITLDRNGDGRWTPGDYSAVLQPDETFYYPKSLTIKQNWSYDQSWNLWETAVDLQKPEAIKKNKPETDRRSRKNTPKEEEEEEEDTFGANMYNTGSRSSNGRGSTPLSF